MSKYNSTFKIAIAQRCIEGASSRQLAREFNVPSSQIRFWTRIYRLHGASSFVSPERPYSAQDKLSMLHRMWAQKWSLTHASAVYNLSSPGILYVWLRCYETSGLEGLRPQKKGKPPMKKALVLTKNKDIAGMTPEELREELEYLRAENAVLKKLEELDKEKRARAKQKR